MKNQHAISIPEAVLTEVDDHLKQAKRLLEPYIIALTPEERRTMLKLGGKSLTFVEKALEYARLNPGLVPPHVDMDAFAVDVTDFHGLWAELLISHQLGEGLEDTTMVAGGEAMHTALAIYHYSQIAAKDDVPGAKAVYEDLKKELPFAHKRRSSSAAGPMDPA